MGDMTSQTMVSRTSQPHSGAAQHPALGRDNELFMRKEVTGSPDGILSLRSRNGEKPVPAEVIQFVVAQEHNPVDIPAIVRDGMDGHAIRITRPILLPVSTAEPPPPDLMEAIPHGQASAVAASASADQTSADCCICPPCAIL